jgi:ketosteroid isomerase-like protein
MLPSDFPKWRTVHAYFAKWSESDAEGLSVLEHALKKSGWRGPYQTGAQTLDALLDRRRTEREEHR